MPGKRKKLTGGSATGGTGDLKPQIITATSPIPSGANDFSTVEISVPRIILGQEDRATIMEVLKVWFYVGMRDFADSTATVGAYLTTVALRQTSDTASISEILGDLAAPFVFATVMKQRALTTSGAWPVDNPVTIDMTDSNGNGYLVATDRMFMTSFDVSGTAAQEATVKILYRMVNVGITEYVGIVASQN